MWTEQGTRREKLPPLLISTLLSTEEPNELGYLLPDWEGKK